MKKINKDWNICSEWRERLSTNSKISIGRKMKQRKPDDETLKSLTLNAYHHVKEQYAKKSKGR